MPHVSRPLIALLLASVVFFAVWMVALKPKSDSGSSSGSAPLQSAVDKAHGAVAQSNAASAAHGGTVASNPAGGPSGTLSPTKPTTSQPAPAHTTTGTTHSAAAATHSATTATHTAAGTPSHSATAATAGSAAHHRTPPVHAKTAPGPARREAAVVKALRARQVLALLFYNDRAADDRAVKQELSSISTHGRRVFKLAIPLRELARYPVITQQVPVTGSPTLVLIDGTLHARTVVGFASSFELAQRIADALAVKVKVKK